MFFFPCWCNVMHQMFLKWIFVSILVSPIPSDCELWILGFIDHGLHLLFFKWLLASYCLLSIFQYIELWRFTDLAERCFAFQTDCPFLFVLHVHGYLLYINNFSVVHINFLPVINEIKRLQEQLKPLTLQLARVKDLPIPEFGTLQAWEARANAAARLNGDSNANDSSKSSQAQGYGGTPMPFLGETKVWLLYVLQVTSSHLIMDGYSLLIYMFGGTPVYYHFSCTVTVS